MRIYMLCTVLVIPSLGNAMKAERFKWKTNRVYHFGPNESYDDYDLLFEKNGDDSYLRLYGQNNGCQNMVRLNLFGDQRPMMQSTPRVYRTSTHFISCDGHWRVIVGKQTFDGHSFSGSEVIISQYRSYPRIPGQYAVQRKNICTILAAWVRSCWRKKSDKNVVYI